MPESRCEFVMPFVTVKSAGGPHDDDAYTAGFEMGHLDAFLNAGHHGAFTTHCVPIQAVNREQADLLAMRWHFTSTFAEFGDETDPEHLWLHAHFTRSADA